MLYFYEGGVGLAAAISWLGMRLAYFTDNDLQAFIEVLKDSNRT